MKKLLAGFLSVCLALTMAGCSAPGVPDAVTTNTGTSKEASARDPSELTQNGASSKSMHAIALPTVKEEVCSDDGTLLFTLSFQKASIDLDNEEIEELITSDLQTRTGDILTEADQICSDAFADQPEYPNWSGYFLDVSYTPTRLDQSVLSLFRNQVSYNGGAHPFVYAESVTYDLQTGSPLLLPDIFDENFNKDVLCALVLKALEPKAEELSYNYQDTVTQLFTEDGEIKEDWYFSRNGLCFHFSPYEIAPYSSGTIIAEIPYEDLTGMMYDQYFPTQVESSTGSMYAETYTEDNAQRFQRIADVELDESAPPILLYSDATVTDLRIESGTQLDGNAKFIATSVVFAADTVGIGDAIRIFTDLSQSDNLLRLVYRSNGREVSSLISLDLTTGNVLLKSE